jgi:hypothetical protein
VAIFVGECLDSFCKVYREVEEKVRAMSEQAKMSMEQEFELDDEDDDDFDVRLSKDGGEDDE